MREPRPAVGLVLEFCAYCAKEFASAEPTRYSRRTAQRSAAHAPRTLLRMATLHTRTYSSSSSSFSIT